MRLFVAAWPSEAVKRHLRAIERHGTGVVRWTPEARWHVTLRFLGEVDDAGPVVDAVGAACAGLDPPTAHLGPRVDRLGSSVAAVPVTGLDALAGAVIAATAHLGQAPDARPFLGHITVARAAGRRSLPAGVAGRPVGHAGAAGRGWEVEAVDVIRSVLGADHHYQGVARVPLGRASLA